MMAKNENHHEYTAAEMSLARLRAQLHPDREPQAARLRAIRAANEARAQAAHQAEMAAQWQPALTAEQVRDALARARKLRALRRP